jgi:hypothetical protein
MGRGRAGEKEKDRNADLLLIMLTLMPLLMVLEGMAKWAERRQKLNGREFASCVGLLRVTLKVS